MKYTIEKMNNILIVDEKPLTGYAFIDEYGHCMIIVYSERKKELLEEYLNGN